MKNNKMTGGAALRGLSSFCGIERLRYKKYNLIVKRKEGGYA